MTDQEVKASQDLAAFLVAQQKNHWATGHDGPTSYLLDRVRDGVRALAKEIAQEVIDAHPTLRQVIRDQAETAVRAALADDKALAQVVSTAMAQGLTRYVRDEDS